jgi:hypothetical protein
VSPLPIPAMQANPPHTGFDGMMNVFLLLKSWPEGCHDLGDAPRRSFKLR